MGALARPSSVDGIDSHLGSGEHRGGITKFLFGRGDGMKVSADRGLGLIDGLVREDVDRE